MSKLSDGHAKSSSFWEAREGPLTMLAKPTMGACAAISPLVLLWSLGSVVACLDIGLGGIGETRFRARSPSP